MKGLLVGLASIVITLPAYAHDYHGNYGICDEYRRYTKHSYCDSWGCWTEKRIVPHYKCNRRHYKRRNSGVNIWTPPINIIIK
jgi:hypothetical protein